ncbi:MAG: AIR synthase, partial [Chloroflexi bacterium]|nr:AIR synthase [Chloroflexota bacterium]
MGTSATLPLGKLPPELLARLIAPGSQPSSGLSSRVVVGPGIGLDCAVLDFGRHYLVAKTDPITFATDEIGWYAVQVNANDIACSGAEPQFFLATVLLHPLRTLAPLATLERLVYLGALLAPLGLLPLAAPLEAVGAL